MFRTYFVCLLPQVSSNFVIFNEILELNRSAIHLRSDSSITKKSIQIFLGIKDWFEQKAIRFIDYLKTMQ